MNRKDSPVSKKLRVSVIIPFKDKSNLTVTCVESLFQYGSNKTELEVILISNNSSQDELLRVKNGISKYQNVKAIEYNQPFNYQKVNNWGAKKAKGNILLFLNNDTELTEASMGLLNDMITKALSEKVGAVGCLLLYGDARHVQHAGVYLRPSGTADHLYIRKPLNSVMLGVDYPLSQDREVTAVTGAVLMVERSKFDEVGGFDEEFILCGGDVDLCIRLNAAGYQAWCISSSGKYILHKESMTRTGTKIPYVDYVKSYKSYITAFDFNTGDRFLPKVNRGYDG